MGGKPRAVPLSVPGLKITKPGTRSYIVSLDDKTTFSFVPHPLVAGVFIKTDICVALVPCPACHAELGEPCHGAVQRWTIGCHTDRQIMATRLRRKVKRARGFILTGMERPIYPADLGNG
jgi:hypothetical protein